MPERFVLELNEAEMAELGHLVRRGEPAYVRERASLLLKLHTTGGLRNVGRSGGLRQHNAQTLRRYVDRYKAQGAKGLLIAKGRGRHRRIFPPQPGAGPSRSREGTA